MACRAETCSGYVILIEKKNRKNTVAIDGAPRKIISSSDITLAYMTYHMRVTNDFSKDLTVYSETRYKGDAIKHRSDAILLSMKKKHGHIVTRWGNVTIKTWDSDW
jgi:hypothetical protein